MYTFSQQIKDHLGAMGIAVVYLFGSRARGVAFATSDYDLGIVFADPHHTALSFKELGELYELLRTAIDPEKGSDIDIAFLQRANASLQMSAIRFGEVLFESSARVRVEFEEGVLQRYDDYLPLQREYEDATFRAFAVSSKA